MGARLSCLRLWRRKDDAEDTRLRKKTLYDALSAFDILTEGCVQLPPNPLQGRTASIPPSQCLLNAHSFYALQKVIPPMSQSMKLELVFATWEHGFSKSALHLQLTAMLETNGRTSKDLLVIIKPAVSRRQKVGSNEPTTVATDDKAGTNEDVMIGCYVPGGVTVGGPKRYHGSEGTFLFDPLSVDNGSHSLTKVCYVASPKANEYYVSAPATGEMLLAIGGGGRGPAIMVDSSLEEVSCATSCPTFDSASYWPLLPMPDDQWEVDGVTVEGGEPKAPLQTMEVWRFANVHVEFPVVE